MSHSWSRGTTRQWLALVALLAAAWAWPACDGETPLLPDASREAGADVGLEAGADMGAEAGVDASLDTSADSAADLSADASDDGSADASSPDGALSDAEAGPPGDAGPGDGGPDVAASDGAVAAGKPIWLVHITDTHIGASTFASTVLAAAVQQVVPTIKPAATIVSGDITENGTAAQWTSYQGIVKGKVTPYPAYLEIPGNHDMKSALGKEFLSGSQTGKAGGGLYGMSYVKAAAGNVRLLRTNTADHTAATSRLLGYFSSGQKSKLLAIKPPAFAVDYTVVTGHHPVGGLFGLQLLGTDKLMKELLSKVNARVYLCGHVHSTHISWINKTLVLQTATLGKPSVLNPQPAYMLVGLDATGPSARLVSVGSSAAVKVSWPVALITTPAQADLGGTNPLAKGVPAGKAVTVRALAFSPKGVTAVQVRVDSGAWISMTAAGKPLWQASVLAPATTGKRTLEVRATSAEGSDTHKIKLLVGP